MQNNDFQNKILVSGVVSNTEFNSNVMNIIRPTASISVFDTVNKDWIENVYVVFSENGDARQFKGLNVGDVIMVTGELAYLGKVGYVIYATEYTILYKNKNNNPKNNRILLFEHCNQQNFICMKGQMISYNRYNHIATMTYEADSNIRGNLDDKYVFPVCALNDVDENFSDCIFIGYFAKNYVTGHLYNICTDISG